jgi:flagellar basal body-associated protein FliL
MADEQKKGAPAPAAAPAAGGGASRLVFMVLPALLAGGAAFGGAKIAGAHHMAAPVASEHVDAPKPPGPTIALDAFLLTIADANKKAHPMKVTLAVEFDAKAKEEETKPLVPRIRDAMLAYLRKVPYEEAFDASSTDKMRGEMLEAVRAGGAPEAQRVLITDLVVQ